MHIFKFGGASVKDTDGVKNLTQIIERYKNEQLVIIVSAMGKTTNALEQLTKAYFNQDDNVLDLFSEIKNYHYNILNQLFGDKHHPIFDEIANTFVEIDWMLEEEPQDDYDFIYDQIVSIGEMASTRIINAYLNASQLPCKWVDARSYIHTDNSYREAKVDWERTEKSIQKDVPALLKTSFIITQGFIGGTTENYSTTLGREGSDYTAAIFASCLNAQDVTIWKDVPGVLNADPKWFDDTEMIAQLSYHDAIELTYYGATVIHPKTIKPLQNKSIKLYVRSFLSPDNQGTEISNAVNPLPVPSFIFKVDQVLISILPKDFSFIIEENLSDIFECFHKHKVKVNTMQNSAISFSVSVDNDPQKIPALIAALQKDYKVKYNNNMELVTIRYYNPATIARVTEGKDVLLEVKSRHTCQMVMKDSIA